MKTLAYLRLSTTEEQQSTSFDVQLSLIREKYPNIDEVYKDTTSGGTPFSKRSGWVDLIQQLESGDTIVVLRMDRLSRDVLEYLVVEKMLNKLGVAIAFIEGVSGSSPMDKMVRTILSAVAEMEKALIGQRIKQSKQYMKEQGKFLGGKVPYGSIVVNGSLIEDREEQEVIKQMITLRKSGLSYSKVSKELTTLGYKTRGGNPFANVQIQRVIKSIL